MSEPRISVSRYRLIEAIFLEALEAGADRDGFLASACGDDVELKNEVLDLLASHDDLSARNVSEFSRPVFGSYRAIRLVGRGGAGVVWEAERDDGEYSKKVAVKLMSGWVLSPAAREQFRRERQVLATLDHPNIARLIDGGVTPDGSPYLVMELVEGQHIDAYVERLNLEPAAREELLLQVLDAVEYAHSRLIVHRDLKPSNIMVGNDGRVRLLDFGTARCLDPESQPSASTVLRAFTPGYASPEQIAGKAVDERADIYSLGVLYEKLLGPVAKRDVVARAKAESLDTRFRTVREFRQAIISQDRTRWRRLLLIGAATLAAVLLVASVWNRSAESQWKRISPAGESWQDPSASAASDWLTFSSDRGRPGQYDIWVARQDGRELEAVTQDAANDSEPAISPDGRFVVFHSDRSPPGLYEYDRQKRKMRWVAEGLEPAFSPDGRWLLFARFDDRTDRGWAGAGNWRVMPARGGSVQVVGAGLSVVLGAVWSPDSGSVLLTRAEALGVSLVSSVWRQKLDGQLTHLRDLKPSEVLCTVTTGGLAVLRHQHGWWTLWRSNWTSTLAAPAESVEVMPRLPGPSKSCSASAKGTFLGVESVEARRYFLPMDWSRGRSSGPWEPLAADNAQHVSASADGRIALLRKTQKYPDETPGPAIVGEVAGKPLALPSTTIHGVVSKDGSRLWLTGTYSSTTRTIWIHSDRPDRPTVVRNEGIPWDLAFDGSFALAYQDSSRPAAIAWLDQDGSGVSTILSHPKWNLYSASLSWDQRWIAFTAVQTDGTVGMYVARFRGKERIPVEDWVFAGHGGSEIWSPVGARLLFLSKRDGRSCLYQQTLDPQTGRPLGDPQAVVHFHGRETVANLPPDSFRMSATRTGIIFSLGRREDQVVRLSR